MSSASVGTIATLCQKWTHVRSRLSSANTSSTSWTTLHWHCKANTEIVEIKVLCGRVHLRVVHGASAPSISFGDPHTCDNLSRSRDSSLLPRTGPPALNPFPPPSLSDVVTTRIRVAPTGSCPPSSSCSPSLIYALLAATQYSSAFTEG